MRARSSGSGRRDVDGRGEGDLLEEGEAGGCRDVVGIFFFSILGGGL